MLDTDAEWVTETLLLPPTLAVAAAVAATAGALWTLMEDKPCFILCGDKGEEESYIDIVVHEGLEVSNMLL